MSPAAAGARRPRVLFIGALPEPVTGQSIACEVLLAALRDRYDVDVIDLSKRGFRQGVDSLARIAEVLQIVYRAWRAQRSADLIYLTVSESFSGNVKDLLLYAACWRKLPRLIVHLHGGAGLRQILVDGTHPLRTLNAFFLRRIGGAVVLGARHTDVYRSTVAADRLYSVANFAPDAIFADADATHRKFATDGPLRLLFLSNLLPGKGHDETLSAFLTLPATAQGRLTIDFAGGFESDEARRAFEALIVPWPNLRYHGIVGGAKKAALFQASHLFCLPTYYPYEGQPISILEAYASGCAVLTTDHSGIGDIFADSVNGLQVPVRSPGAIRDAILTALADRALLARMAEHNRAQALRQFRASQFSANMLNVFERTLLLASAPTAGAVPARGAR